jgi:hypothetical protein
MTHNMDVLSPHIFKVIAGKISSTRHKTGRVRIRIVISIATISASGVDLETEPCLLDIKEIGTDVSPPPRRKRIDPVVER